MVFQFNGSNASVQYFPFIEICRGQPSKTFFQEQKVFKNGNVVASYANCILLYLF